jgi:hypothetical protein
MSLVCWAPSRTRGTNKVFLPLALVGAPSIVIVTFITATGVGQRLQGAASLDCRRFKQYENLRSAGSFVIVSVDSPTPPGQIVRLHGEPLTTTILSLFVDKTCHPHFYPELGSTRTRNFVCQRAVPAGFREFPLRRGSFQYSCREIR